MLHSQGNDKSSGGQGSPSVEGVCLYLRVIACARFSPIEFMLVMHVFELGWMQARFGEGSRKARAVKLGASALSRLSGFACPEILKARESLETGNVLVNAGEGFWRLNPSWREWIHEDGASRISPETHEYVTGQPDRPILKVKRHDV